MRTMWTFGFLLLQACVLAEEVDPRLLEVDTQGTTFATKPAGQNGEVDYCGSGPASQCVEGEGDCDAGSHCAAGLVCGANNGPRFGMWAGIDVCVDPTCVNGVLDPGELGIDCDNDPHGCGDCLGCPVFPDGHSDHCEPMCPCPAGEGDCDEDAGCADGLVCVSGVGGRFGYPGGYDVCLPDSCDNGVLDAGEDDVDCGGACGPCASCPPNNRSWTCDPWECTCPSGWGDCDSDAECDGTLTCPVVPNGAQFPSIYKDFSVCVPPHCDNGVLDAGLGEVTIDCGGVCGTVCPISAGPAVDTCAEAMGLPGAPVGSTTGSAVGWTAQHAGSCGSGAPGPDAVVPFDVPPLTELEVDLRVLGGVGSLYLVEDCADSSVCLDLHEGTATDGLVGVAWRNDTETPRRVYAILDTDAGGSSYELEVRTRSYATPLAWSDTCAGVPALAPLATGRYHVDLTGATNQLESGYGCTFWGTGNTDGMLRVRLEPFQRLDVAFTTPFEDGALVLVTDCTSSGSCVEGVDAAATGGTEILTWLNTSGSVAHLALVLDAWALGDPLTLGLLDVRLTP